MAQLDVMEYDEQTGTARGKYRTLYLFNDRLLIAKRKTKGIGSLKKFRHKFDSLEDLSLVSVEQYGISDGNPCPAFIPTSRSSQLAVVLLLSFRL